MEMYLESKSSIILSKYVSTISTCMSVKSAFYFLNTQLYFHQWNVTFFLFFEGFPLFKECIIFLSTRLKTARHKTSRYKNGWIRNWAWQLIINMIPAAMRLTRGPCLRPVICSPRMARRSSGQRWLHQTDSATNKDPGPRVSRSLRAEGRCQDRPHHPDHDISDNPRSAVITFPRRPMQRPRKSGKTGQRLSRAQMTASRLRTGWGGTVPLTLRSGRESHISPRTDRHQIHLFSETSTTTMTSSGK